VRWRKPPETDYQECNPMKKHLFTILNRRHVDVASSPARAQNIVATHDAYGHTVWVASDEAKPQPKPADRDSSNRGSQTVVSSSPRSSADSSSNPAQPASTEAAPPRYSGLVYWSNKEHRWKAVPLASSATMKAARRAAQEVNDMVAVPISSSDSRALKQARPVDLKSDNLTQSVRWIQ